ncbi:hypothetical protein GPECTOR_37g222 [Gonium pectorale]|uniref:Uncharacterized protein n=1 Tax=Gonium pectorale TaxID=33097 RepID=A0A150GBJ2_GONPE|nr:hypothetical protein GPECTOR_37g222 [Gonium pectorale]|eukprot:KXZ47216.1 hypothetical protein GPECTOR_37g222 [Gonium pectorale]
MSASRLAGEGCAYNSSVGLNSGGFSDWSAGSSRGSGGSDVRGGGGGGDESGGSEATRPAAPAPAGVLAPHQEASAATGSGQDPESGVNPRDRRIVDPASASAGGGGGAAADGLSAAGGARYEGRAAFFDCRVRNARWQKLSGGGFSEGSTVMAAAAAATAVGAPAPGRGAAAGDGGGGDGDGVSSSKLHELLSLGRALAQRLAWVQDIKATVLRTESEILSEMDNVRQSLAALLQDGRGEGQREHKPQEAGEGPPRADLQRRRLPSTGPAPPPPPAAEAMTGPPVAAVAAAAAAAVAQRSGAAAACDRPPSQRAD